MKKIQKLKKGVVYINEEGIDDYRVSNAELYAQWQDGKTRRKKRLTTMDFDEVERFFAKQKFKRVRLDPSAQDHNVGLGRSSYSVKKYLELLKDLF